MRYRRRPGFRRGFRPFYRPRPWWGFGYRRPLARGWLTLPILGLFGCLMVAFLPLLFGRPGW